MSSFNGIENSPMTKNKAIEIVSDMLSDMQVLHQLPVPDRSLKHPKVVTMEALQTLIDYANFCSCEKPLMDIGRPFKGKGNYCRCCGKTIKE